MMPPPPSHLRLRAQPDELAEALSHFHRGVVFLDSSTERGGISILSAAPEEVESGHLAAPEALRTLWNKYQSPAAPDLGFPLGGLFGTIDFDGSFRFGAYPHLLIHHQDSGDWFASGNAQDRFADAIAAAGRDESLKNEPPQLKFKSELGEGRYREMVATAQRYIAAGDVYQVNLAHRFSAPWPAGTSPIALYRRLREVSPAPYSAFLETPGGRTILSSSPELFLRMSGRTIETRPIKGTRPRFADPARDAESAIELVTSEKETAELVMITDLERNDLGQVCEFGSVTVTDLLKLEKLAQVFHLVSTVRGLARPENDHIEVLRRCFPGGSISGAPKKRALEIIQELEPTPRGLYTGSVGYLGFNGESQFNIAIRTAVIEENEVSFFAGAGIVSDSDPAAEYEETLHKARGIRLAFGDPGA